MLNSNIKNAKKKDKLKLKCYNHGQWNQLSHECSEPSKVTLTQVFLVLYMFLEFWCWLKLVFYGL
jgi:hypothetical protein